MSLDNSLIFLLCPPILFDMRIKMIVPPVFENYLLV